MAECKEQKSEDHILNEYNLEVDSLNQDIVKTAVLNRLIQAIEKRRKADRIECGDKPCDVANRFCRTILLLSAAATAAINKAIQEAEVELYKDGKGKIHYKMTVSLDVRIRSKCGCRE